MQASVINRILFEDNHLLILNKLPGEIVQADKTGDVCLIDTVKNYLKEKYHKPGNVFLGLVHRLDRPTSGAVIFTKTSKALSRLTILVKNREVEKTYWAITKTKPTVDSGIFEDFLIKNEKLNKSFVVNADKKGSKKSTLHYTIVSKSNNYYLWQIKLETGRHHQIRVQLSSRGFAIKGDLKYGIDRPNKNSSISLHAKMLQFSHPVTKQIITIDAPTPTNDIWDVF